MDANQRSETNNQTNNGANEKWTEGAKGDTTSGPNDHTYPNGATMQQAQPGMGPGGTQQQGQPAGAAGQDWFQRDDSKLPATGRDLHGGSMQSQQTGGSGPQQGITDSHQRQMEIHSEAWGLLEQPVGRHAKNTGVDVHPHAGNSQAAHDLNPQNVAQPELRGGSMGHHHQHYDAPQVVGESPVRSAQADLSATPHEELYGRDQESFHAPRSAMQAGPQNAQSGGGQSAGGDGGSEQRSGGHSQYSADRDGSQTGEHARDTGTEDVHLSNDVAGGLPRSPGNSGPRSDNPGWKPGGSMQRDPAVHESNDTVGGLPRSPAGANKLAGDRKMDDDTGFSRK
ncbi:hypothetical protein [Massilia sp. DD77]|uniref:hypothetical protein n=1 Tax=Massilia sp. DD77 TaxID=3109349 RepID=UPI0030003996